MCLRTTNKESTVLREPMTAYKIVTVHKTSRKKVTINSIYYKHEWKLGRTYYLSKKDIEANILSNTLNTYHEINVGFHLYLKDPKQHLEAYQDDPFMTIPIGRFAILKGVIPAGSNIWTSPYEPEIVSDHFVPKKCYTFIQRKPFLGIKRKPKKLYYKTE